MGTYGLREIAFEYLITLFPFVIVGFVIAITDGEWLAFLRINEWPLGTVIVATQSFVSVVRAWNSESTARNSIRESIETYENLGNAQQKLRAEYEEFLTSNESLPTEISEDLEKLDSQYEDSNDEDKRKAQPMRENLIRTHGYAIGVAKERRQKIEDEIKSLDNDIVRNSIRLKKYKDWHQPSKSRPMAAVGIGSVILIIFATALYVVTYLEKGANEFVVVLNPVFFVIASILYFLARLVEDQPNYPGISVDD